MYRRNRFAYRAGANAACAKRRFERARDELKDWRPAKANVIAFDPQAARARFEKIRALDPDLASSMMITVGNGEAFERLDGEDSGE